MTPSTSANRSKDKAKLLAALWGNRADLGFRFGASGGPSGAGAERIVVDQSAEMWAALGPAADVVVVADNAGRELLADLVLIDHLLQHGQADSISLHVKPSPYYVSDATTPDVVGCLRRLSAAKGSAAKIASRLHAALSEGKVSVYTHDFYCAPWSYHQMPAELAVQFRQATLTILKGDLNYRKLVGDRAWSPTTSFTDVAAYFPSAVAVLRALKSDVITGLDAVTVADLDATGQPWRTDSSHGLIQVEWQ